MTYVREVETTPAVSAAGAQLATEVARALGRKLRCACGRPATRPKIITKVDLCSSIVAVETSDSQ